MDSIKSPNRDRALIWGTAIGFNLLWFAAVWEAPRSGSTLTWLTFGLFMAWVAVFSERFRDDARMAVAGVLIAITVEPIWLAQGLLAYPSLSPYNLPPDWIVMLWVGFAVCFNHCLYWLQNRPLLAMALGAFGSVSSITSATHLGATTMPTGWLNIAWVYASVWAIVTPLLAWLAARLKNEAADLPAGQLP